MWFCHKNIIEKKSGTTVRCDMELKKFLLMIIFGLFAVNGAIDHFQGTIMIKNLLCLHFLNSRAIVEQRSKGPLYKKLRSNTSQN